MNSEMVITALVFSGGPLVYLSARPARPGIPKRPASMTQCSDLGRNAHLECC
jgi:hypothetical protein